MRRQQSSEKDFDCMKWLRETRKRMNEKMASMTSEEFCRQINEAADKDPFFSQIPKAGIVRPRPKGSEDESESAG